MVQHIISAWQKLNGTILHLGAGECTELPRYLATQAEQIVLVEPDFEAAQALKRRTEAESRVKVIEAAVVAGRGGFAKLHRYNIAGVATLHPLEAPPTQWPGLREITQLDVETLNIIQLLKQVPLSENKCHWLIIEAPGEELQLLSALRENDIAQKFSHLSLAIGSLTPQAEETDLVFVESLEETGYRLEHVFKQERGIIYHAKLDHYQRLNVQLQNELENSKNKVEILTLALEEFKDKIKKVKAKEESKEIKEIFENERKKLESFTKKELKKSVKQLEAFLNIQEVLRTGLALPSMHDWPVSPDFAMYLIGMINKNKYNYILEFGSGSSTIIIARALKKLAIDNNLAHEVRQVSFEHLEYYHEKTYSELCQANLEKSVSLELAPLEPYEFSDGNVYNYYNCREYLLEMFKSSCDESAKVLIIVDGPPATTGKWARYPALPIVLETLPHCEVHFVLDDYYRKEEKELIEEWKKILDEKNVPHELVVHDLEKGAATLSFHISGSNN